jgi:hypothetical protein
VNLAGEQIDTGQQTDCAVALVLVVACSQSNESALHSVGIRPGSEGIRRACQSDLSCA